MKHIPFKLYFLLLIPLFNIVFNLNYHSNFYEDFFSIDDLLLIQIPQMQAPFNFNLLKSLFTFGNHVDYYPIRDLSYWFDVNILGGSESNTSAFKAMNLGYFYVLLLFLFLILFELTNNYFISLFATLIWSLNPFHNEMLFWVAARKDLLFLTFFSTSVYFFIKDNKQNQKSMSYYVLGLTFFILACFTKAAGVLAILALPVYYFLFKRKSRYAFLKSSIAVILSIAFVVLNRLNYADHNSMYFAYSFDYQLKAVFASLGRSIAGFFFTSYNAVDFENWGNWVEFNQKFIAYGYLFLFFLIGLFITLIKKQRIFLIFLTLFVLVLISIPGINPLHRNFYSVRYYELPFLIIFVAIFVYISNYTNFPKTKFKIILMAPCVFFFISHISESSNWKSNLAVMEKSLSIAPSNPSLMRLYLTEFENLKRWGKVSASDIALAEKVKVELHKKCLTEISSDFISQELCLNLWFNFKELNGLKVDHLFTDRAVEVYHEKTGLSLLRIKLSSVNYKQYICKDCDFNVVLDLYSSHSLSTEKIRYIYLYALYRLDKKQQAFRELNDYNDSYLITRSGLLNFFRELDAEVPAEFKKISFNLR